MDSIQDIRSRLLIWGRSHYQEYPWRTLRDPWLGLLAEVLLQRTSATHVKRYFDEIRELFPTPEAVLSASNKELEILSVRFGLHRRLKTLLSVAYYLDDNIYYPTDIAQLTRLYGIGHYTASAFLSLHMHTRAILIDSNVARWLSRLTGREKPTDVRRSEWIWPLANSLTPAKDFRDYNYAVLDFTMMVCKQKNPECMTCPLATSCVYSRIKSADS